MAHCDIQSLLVDAKCFACQPPGILQLLKVQLLCEIAAAGGVGGGGVTCGAGAPTSTPASGCGLYIQTDSVPPGQLWEYFSGAWH